MEDLTLRMQQAADEFESEVCTYTLADFLKKKEDYELAEDSEKPSILAEVYQMLEECHIPFEKRRPMEAYLDLAKKAGLSTESDLQISMLLNLYKIFPSFATPKDYMQRLVDRLGDPAWKEDSLGLRILKQFIKYGDYLKETTFYGKPFVVKWVKARLGRKPTLEEVLDNLDDSIFGAEDGREQELLKVSRELAEGAFCTGGRTKKALYYFAMAFGMTYYSGAEDEVMDHRTDIQKNLFRDFYTNNLLRFSMDLYRERASNFESNPSGQGINYKNYTEVISLYYLRQNCTGAEKIQRSSAMIERVKNNPLPKEEVVDHPEETAYYRGLAYLDPDRPDDFRGDVFSLPEAEFERFIRGHFHDLTPRHEPSLLRDSQNSAFAQYQELLSKLNEIVGEADVKSTCSYGIFFVDTDIPREELKAAMLAREPGLDPQRIDDLMDVLRAIDKRIGCDLSAQELTGRKSEQQAMAKEIRKREKEGLSPREIQVELEYKAHEIAKGELNQDEFLGTAPDTLEITDPKKMTRTALMTAYYYYFTQKNIEPERMSMKDFLIKFKTGVDPYLRDAYYTRFHSRDFFDLVVAYSAYFYIYR